MSEQHYFRVNGMSSADCVYTLESAIKALKGVDKIEVDLETGMLLVNGDVSSGEIIAAVGGAGYNAILIAD